MSWNELTDPNSTSAMRPDFSSITLSISGWADSMMTMNMSIMNANGRNTPVMPLAFVAAATRPPESSFTSPRPTTGTSAVAWATSAGSRSSAVSRRAFTASLIANSSQPRSSENMAAGA